MGYTDIFISQPPKGGGYIDLKNKVGHLLAFLGTDSIVTEPDTMSQVPGATREVATVDYVDLDDGQGGVIQWGARVDKVGVVNKLRGQRNAILGRITLGEAKPGRTAPFILADHEPADAERFMNVWLPANRAALAGKEQQPPAAPAAPSTASGPAGQPLSAYVNPPAGQAAFPGQVVPNPAAAPPAAPAPAPAPLPVAAGVANGQEQPYSPEAVAAIQRMMAAGQLPAFPVPTP